MFALAFPSLNRLPTHNKRTRFLCPSMLMWCSLHITRDDHEDNVCTLYVKKHLSRVTRYTHVTHLRA